LRKSYFPGALTYEPIVVGKFRGLLIQSYTGTSVQIDRSPLLTGSAQNADLRSNNVFVQWQKLMDGSMEGRLMDEDL